MNKAGKYNLGRFLEAQEFCEIYTLALSEMKAGRKRSHWIWYVFPQVKGLGLSYNSRLYGVVDLEEARQYLADDVLGTRLREITQAVLSHKDIEANTLMNGEIDAVKLCSSMTLFDIISPNDIFEEVLDVFFEGKRCRKTIEICGKLF